MSAPGANLDRMEIRSSPRFLAPDWSDRLRRAPAGAWLLIVVFVAVLIAHDPRQSAGLVALAVVLAVLSGPTLFKIVNTRVVITPDLVEARDGLRMRRRCRRGDLVGIVPGVRVPSGGAEPDVIVPVLGRDGQPVSRRV
jgi:hypothetical protein